MDRTLYICPVCSNERFVYHDEDKSNITKKDLNQLRKFLADSTLYPHVDKAYHNRAISKFEQYLKEQDMNMLDRNYHNMSKDRKIDHLERVINMLTVLSDSYKKTINLFKVAITGSVLCLLATLALSFMPFDATGQVITLFILSITALGGSIFGMGIYTGDNKQKYDGFVYSPPELLKIMNKEYERVLISDE